jgi:hypothetical protein
MGLVEANMDAVIHHIQISHMNAYGIRKPCQWNNLPTTYSIYCLTW